jgi:cytochrome c oxidase assembly protein subunit 15
VLGWPLLAALAHTGGAALLTLLLTSLLARASLREDPTAQRHAPVAAAASGVSA